MPPCSTAVEKGGLNLRAGRGYIIFQGKLDLGKDLIRMNIMTAHHSWRSNDARRVRAVSVSFGDVAISALGAQSKRNPVATICDNPAQPPPTR